MSTFTSPEAALAVHADMPIDLSIEFLQLAKIEVGGQPLFLTIERSEGQQMHNDFRTMTGFISWTLKAETALVQRPLLLRMILSRRWEALAPSGKRDVPADATFTKSPAYVSLYLNTEKTHSLLSSQMRAVKYPMADWLTDANRGWLITQALPKITARAERRRESAEKLRRQAREAAAEAKSLENSVEDLKAQRAMFRRAARASVSVS